jgi:hypothetical protein
MPMNKKLQQELKFRIGEQYEKYEFELDWVTSMIDNNLRYEVYRYIGKDKSSIFNFEIDKILLAYNCDFLAGVFYFIKGECYFRILSEIQKESFCTSRIINLIEIDENIIMLFIANNKIRENELISTIKILSLNSNFRENEKPEFE